MKKITVDMIGQWLEFLQSQVGVMGAPELHKWLQTEIDYWDENSWRFALEEKTEKNTEIGLQSELEKAIWIFLLQTGRELARLIALIDQVGKEK